MEPTNQPVTTPRTLAGRITVGVLLAFGAFAALVLILVHAARSHFPVLPFAALLVVALVASMHAQARRRSTLKRLDYVTKTGKGIRQASKQSPITRALTAHDQMEDRAAAATNDPFSNVA